jgi:hypothetical protein
MLKISNLESPYFQYFIGLLINLVVIVILLSSDVTYNNLQMPENEFKNNIWRYSDTFDYLNLAKNYLEYGVIGEGKIPSSSRSIGYPIYLSFFMQLFIINWLFIVFLFQAVVFAFIYPIFTKIIQLVFADNKRLVIWSFLFMLFSGMYFTFTTVILTDAIFTLLLTAGICFGILTIKKQSWFYLTAHIILIAIAGQIRPQLFLYIIPNFFILLAAAKRYNVLKHKKVKSLIFVSSILVLITCNLPTLRNYINYRVISPSTVLQGNLFNSHATRILIEEGQNTVIDSIYSKLNTVDNLNEKLDTEMDFTISTFTKYPVMALKLFVTNIAKILINNYYYNFSHFWIKDKTNKRYSFEKSLLQKSNTVIYTSVIFSFIYFLIYMFFISFCVRLIKGKKYLFLFSILIFISYFLIPAGFVWGAIRFRLPVEGFIIIFSLFEIQQLLLKKNWFNKSKI